MIALKIISAVFCCAYIIFILFKFGVPVSISETTYLLDNKWDWMFGAWTVLLAVPMGFYWFSVAPPNLIWMCIVTVIAILMIGVSSFYKSYHNKTPDNESKILKQGDVEKIILKNKYVEGKSKTYTVLNENKKFNSFKDFIKDLINKFKPSEFLKYGWVKPIHYINSLIAIALVNVYCCITMPSVAVTYTILMNVMFILIGMKVDGVYNPQFSVDVNNKAWIFFMEVICFLEAFLFI